MTRPRPQTEMFKRDDPETERLLASNPRQKLTVHRGQLYFNDPRVAQGAAPASSSGQSQSARIAEKYGARRYFGGGFSDNTLVDLNQSSSEGDVTSGTEYSDYDYVTDERAHAMERGMRGASVPAGIQTRTAASNRRGRASGSSWSNTMSASTAMIALVVCALLVALGLVATGAVSTDAVSQMFSVEREAVSPHPDVSDADHNTHYSFKTHRVSHKQTDDYDDAEETETKVQPVEVGSDADAIGPRAAAKMAEEAAKKRAAARARASAKLGTDDDVQKAASERSSSKRRGVKLGDAVQSGKEEPKAAGGAATERRSHGHVKSREGGAKLGDFQAAEEAAARMRDKGFTSPEEPTREEPAAETEEESRRRM